MAVMITSKLTSKAQTTIPRAVRAALGLHDGDMMSYQIEGGRVVLMRAGGPTGPEDPFGAFSEWNSEADRSGYAAF